MVSVTLSDGSTRSFPVGTPLNEVARSISPSLAKQAVVAKLDGQLLDLTHPLEQDGTLQILTLSHPEALEVIRHSCAHLLAQAVKDLYPETQVAIGPVIENGFYYDFLCPQTFSSEDLEKIEAHMRVLGRKNFTLSRQVVSRAEAIAHFDAQHQAFKTEIIRQLPEHEPITLYTQGNFTDLCRGPHVPNTTKLKFFKLMKVSGAYWRGDSSQPMLQRIYGTAWLTQADLDAHLHRLEEAERRDHRKLGKTLSLFHLQEEAPGMVFWHPSGWQVWLSIEQYLREVLAQSGYQEIKTPVIIDRKLWELSGHWENYRENMFITESEKRTFAVKPMNCPGHVQVFNQKIRSYRDLPLRLSEFGSCHRNEPSGALHGLMRVRGFVQDDAHIFCQESSILEEAEAFNRLVQRVYARFGFHDVSVKLALKPEQHVGEAQTWEKAENSLRAALKACHLDWEELPGEGAFYGPKIEYHIKDAIGRSWQCGTLQLDFVLPERLNALYVDRDNTKKRPVMLHRAVLGSMERFIGILIEHYAGNFPLWLAPIQVMILNVSETHQAYAHELGTQFQQQGIRVQMDLRNEKIAYRIREATLLKVPLQIVVGDREVESDYLAVRTGRQGNVETVHRDRLLAFIQDNPELA